MSVVESRLEPKSVCAQTSTLHAALWREREKNEEEKKLFQAHA